MWNTSSLWEISSWRMELHENKPEPVNPCTYNQVYCIVENFAVLWLFVSSPQIWGYGMLWYGKSEQSAKVFSNLWKFAPLKVSHYVVYVCMYDHTYIHCPNQAAEACIVQVTNADYSAQTYFQWRPSPRKWSNHLASSVPPTHTNYIILLCLWPMR